MPKFIKEGTAELTHGIDDKRPYSIQQLAKNADSLSSVINLENEYTSGDYSYAGGYMLLRYLAKQSALNNQGTFMPSEIISQVNLTESNATYYVGNTVENPVATTVESTYSVGSANNYVYTPTANFKQIITTNDNSWTIEELASNNTLNAGAGDDSIKSVGNSNLQVTTL